MFGVLKKHANVRTLKELCAEHDNITLQERVYQLNKHLNEYEHFELRYLLLSYLRVSNIDE